MLWRAFLFLLLFDLPGRAEHVAGPARSRVSTLGTVELSGRNGQSFSVSVVDEATARALFREMAALRELAYERYETGCYARAHYLTRWLERKGVLAGKLFIDGELVVPLPESTIKANTVPGKLPVREAHWSYHVAPVIVVRVMGKGESPEERPFVLDPSAFAEPVPDGDLVRLRSGRGSSYFTSRFHYQPGDTLEARTAYREEDLDRAEAWLRENSRRK